MTDDRQCNTDGCTNAEVVDWGVCGSCFQADNERFIEQVFGLELGDGDDDD